MGDGRAAQRMCTLLKEKLICFDRYRFITEQMAAVCEKKGALHLDGFLAKRRQCIQQIQNLDAAIKRLPKTKGGTGDSVWDSSDAGIADYLNRISAVIASIDVLDGLLMGEVKTEGRHIKSELVQMQAERKAADGYRQPRGYASKFVDTRG